VNRRSLLLFAALFLAVLAVIAVAVSQYEPKAKLRRCGHLDQKTVKEVLQGFLGVSYRHHCSSLAAITDLKVLHLSQRIYENETGTNATKLEELGEDFSAKRNRFGLTLISEGTNWSARIAQQNILAGHYLFTSVGRLHFHTTRPATTNDHVLHDWSQ
jgi:hypothetical protein